MLGGVDGDVFGKVTRLGRAAAEAVSRAIAGEMWDPYHASRCLDVLIAAANGIPSLPVALAELAGLRGSPLLARFAAENALQRIREASSGPKCTVLDLILRSVVERSILRGDLATQSILNCYCGEVLDRAILTGRGGFMDQHGPALLNEARGVLAPVALAAATILEARPDAKRLGLARSHADVTPDTNLLVGL
jgi:hypothetical protein